MHMQIAGKDAAQNSNVGLQQETDGLAHLHLSWAQHVAAWQIAHEVAVANAHTVLARMDALIAKLESR